MELGLEGKPCIVTGASRGIGRATAAALCAEGARVLLVARGEDEVEQAAAACRAVGGEALAATVDVVASGAAEQLAERCHTEFGRIDVVVNNAGTSAVRGLDELTDDDWQGQWQLNVIAPLRLTQVVAPLMAASGGGSIVNVCSSSGRRPSSTNAAYSVTKAAELALTRAQAAEYEEQGVRINAVAPGPVTSELWLGAGGLLDQVAERQGVDREQALDAASGRLPLKRYGTVEEVAAVVVLLCAGRLAPSGAIWPVDGGHVPATIS